VEEWYRKRAAESEEVRSMAEQRTCGAGLAEQSVLPRTLGELVGSVAEILEVHMTALDPDDQNARREHDVYKTLAQEHRETAARLRATADRMAAQRDLPMGRHDEQAMAGPRVRETFETYVRTKQKLLALLRQAEVQDQELLAAMSGPGGEAPG
jgi:hypothetical protein